MSIARRAAPDERINACLIAARISRRFVVAGAGSTVKSTFVMALARVSPAARSLTAIVKLTEPSAVTRPTRCARRAANAASRVLPVPPSACARASHSSASTKIVAVGGSEGFVGSGGRRRRRGGRSGIADGYARQIVLRRRRRGRSRGRRARFGGRPRAAPAAAGVIAQRASRLRCRGRKPRRPPPRTTRRRR